MGKVRLVLSVVLVCVAPAMAVDFYEMPGGDTWNGGASWTGYNYNPTPDPAAVAAWEATYVPPFNPWTSTPYYESQGASAVPVGANLRQNMITARCEFGAGDVIQANVLGVADSYWPLNYSAFQSTFTTQEIRHTGAANMTANTMQIGHDRVNEFAIPNGVVIANQGKYNIRAGSLTVGDVRMLNESKIITFVPGTAPYGLNWYSITSEAANSNAVSVNIGNVYLNETMLHMNVNAGKWTITGDVGLQNAGEGNGTMVLFGNRTAARSTVTGNAAELVIKWSTLLDLIDNGMLWTKTGTYSSTFRPGTNFVFVDDPGSLLTLDQIPDAHKITRANIFNELDVLDLGNGMVSAVVCIPVNVPEPATMALLGLGAIAAFRRKR